MKLLRCGFSLLVVVAALALAWPAAAQSDQVVYSTGQYFQNGVMLWRSDTGHIWVIAHNGQVLNFPAASYSGLPDNPPLSSVVGNRPILGFGKVWSNFSQVRDLIGPAIYQEVGFFMRIRTVGDTLYLTQSNGIVYQINPDNTWVYAEQPTEPGPRIISFTSDSQKVNTGGTVTVSWAAHGVDAVQIEVIDPTTASLIGKLPFLPLTGSQTITVPVGMTPRTLNITLSAVKITFTSAGDLYDSVEEKSIAVEIVEPAIVENSPGATFQSFERGFMIWRADTLDIYVFLDFGRLGVGGGRVSVFPHSAYSTLPPNPYQAVPPGRVRPEFGFGQVWGNTPAVREALGWATRSEQGYLATARLENNVPASITVPDGSTIGLDLAAGRWSWLDMQP
ncbi:MAG: hypothetical protein HRF48_16045 [Chloroflexota bacterium]|jgi:hypothetical protein